MKITIDTSRYYRSHAKQPRGTGHWCFENHAGEIVLNHSGTYSAAKRAAESWGRQNGAIVLYTCP